MPLMLWLSPAFPVGAFAYSHGLEWAVEAGDIHDARSLGGWLVDLLTFGAPRADAILFAAAYRSAEAGDWPALFEMQRACRRARALGRAAPRDDGPRRRFRRGGARVLGLRAAPAPRVRGVDRLSGRGRRRRGRPWPAARSEPSGLRAGARRQRRLRRRQARPDWPDRRPENPGRAPAATSRTRARGRSDRPSPISAAAPSAPTSPACVTKPNIRGFSAHEQFVIPGGPSLLPLREKVARRAG